MMEQRFPIPRQAPPASQVSRTGLERGIDRHWPSADGGLTARLGPRAAPGPRKLRAALLTPTLLLGGAERWLISLAREARDGIEWTGTALTERAPANPQLLQELSCLMPVHCGPWAAPGQTGVVRCANAREALQAAVRGADALIVWGIGNLGRIVQDLAAVVVYVSHGGSARTIRSSEAAAKHLAAVSESARMRFSPALRPAVTVIHNGIDVERCMPTVSRQAMRAAWGFGKRDRLIGYIGRYAAEKNPAAAAWAARELGGDHYAVYMGEGAIEGRLRAELEKAAGSRVRFLPMDRQVGNVLRALDAFVLASPAEGFSLSITEAWYCRLPVVATRVGAVPELERQHGQLVSPVPIDPTAGQLARGVQHALSGEFQRDVVPRAHEMVCRHYTASRMAERWIEYLQRVVGASQPERADWKGPAVYGR